MKPLTPQEKRMRELMEFTYEDNSHDILAEHNLNFVEVFNNPLLKEQEKGKTLDQGITKGADGNPDWEWIKKELKSAKTITHIKPICFDVGSDGERIDGNFAAKVTSGSNAVKVFINQLKNAIASDPEAQKYLKEGGKFTIQAMDLIAGASNSLNGSVTPTMDNNYNPKKYSDEGYTHKNNSETWKKNLQYAIGRGNAVAEELKKSLPKEGINITEEGIKVTPFIIDTGGVIDGAKGHLPNNGQVVRVWMKVCWEKTETTRTPALIEEFKRCMGGITVEVNYEGTGHKCNHATFKIFANGVALKRTGFGTSSGSINPSPSDYADLNNGSKDDLVLNKERSAGTPGGTRFNQFRIEGEELGKLLTVENLKKFKGDLQIQAECINTPNVTSDLWSDKRKKLYSIDNLLLPPMFNSTRLNRLIYLYGKDGKIKTTSMINWMRENIEEFKDKNTSTIKELLGLSRNANSEDIIKKLSRIKRITSEPNPKIPKGKDSSFGCHKGVAEVNVVQNGREVDTQNVTTPRFADGTIYTLGPVMEACSAKWNQLVKASSQHNQQG